MAAVKVGDEAAVRAVVDEGTAAWNVGDAKAYSAHVAEDVSFTSILGVVMYGRKAVESCDDPLAPARRERADDRDLVPESLADADPAPGLHVLEGGDGGRLTLVAEGAGEPGHLFRAASRLHAPAPAAEK